MGKYTSSSRRQPLTPRDRVPPLVRGIGCLLFVLVPFVSYGIAAMLVTYGARAGWPIPPSWFGSPSVPGFILGNPRLAGLGSFISNQTNLTANLVFTVAISVVMFGVLSIVYGYLFAAVGPSQYGPLDVPPPRVKTKKYKR